MRKHARTCSSELERLTGTVVLPADAQLAQPPRPAGRRPLDVLEKLRGTHPAFTDDGDDERIDLFFQQDLVPLLLKCCVDKLPGLLYRRLWSRHAPTEFQSIVRARGIIVHIDTRDLDTQDVTVVSHGPSITKTFARQCATWMYNFAEAVCTTSVPARCDSARELAQAAAMAQLLESHPVRTALQHPKGIACTELRRRVDIILGSLMADMGEAMPSAHA